MAASAAITLVLGSLHLLYTFRGTKLLPRDAALRQRMAEVSPVISRQTTMWKAWVRPDVLFRSAFLAILGALFLLGYLVLARKYWFSAPLRLLAVAFVLYAA